MDISKISITQLFELYNRRKLSPVEVVKAYLTRIDSYSTLLNCFITTTAELGLANAEKLEKRLSKKNFASRLMGVPFAIKDLINTKDIKTTAGSLIFKNHIPKQDAFVIKKLIMSGYILLGKTNMHEIALGVTNINPHYGTCKNPWDVRRISGGSSGGSAVAVASGLCLCSLGSDTGGSIRIPASLCGIVGLKPTYGRVSLRGVLPLSVNLDHVGPMARCVKDIAIVLQIIAGYDQKDKFSIRKPIDDYLSNINEGIRDLRIAYAANGYFNDCEDDVNISLEDTIKVFQGLGAKVDMIEVPSGLEAAKANRIMVIKDAATVYAEKIKVQAELFGEDVLARLKEGITCPNTVYEQARESQKKLAYQFQKIFKQYDILITPTTPMVSPLIEKLDSLEQAKYLTKFTAPFNLTGLPALSIPCGFSKSGMPIGMQMITRSWSEAVLLKAAYSYERETNWLEKTPKLI